MHARLAVSMASKGGLSLFGTSPEIHRLFAEHHCLENRVMTEGRGSAVDEVEVACWRMLYYCFVSELSSTKSLAENLSLTISNIGARNSNTDQDADISILETLNEHREDFTPTRPTCVNAFACGRSVWHRSCDGRACLRTKFHDAWIWCVCRILDRGNCSWGDYPHFRNRKDGPDHILCTVDWVDWHSWIGVRS